MKHSSFPLFAVLALFPFSVQAQVQETPVALSLVEGGNPQGYARGSNDQGLLFSTSQSATPQLIPYERIRGEGLDKQIRFEDRVEALAEARAAFNARNYGDAAEAFGKVARNYAIILSVPQNFATEALFYQIESLKRAGSYEAMSALVNHQVAVTIDTKLPESFRRSFEFQKLWAMLGQNDFPGLKAALEGYQEPVIGSASQLKSPNFRKFPVSEVAELGYLRAKVYESEGDKDRALEDFYRSFTLAFGNDPLLAKLAMGAAMEIHKADPQLARESKVAMGEMQSIAFLFSKRFGTDSMPEDVRAFAVRPASQLPQVVEEEAGEFPVEGGVMLEGESPEGTPAPEGEGEGEAKGKGKEKAKAKAKAKEE